MVQIDEERASRLKEKANRHMPGQEKKCIPKLAYRWQYSNRNTVELESLAEFGALARLY